MAGEWQLVWQDEFDYTGLPDSTRWDYEEGFVRNQEMQYYTRARPENARVENGMLIIEGRREKFRNPRYVPDSSQWQTNREYASCTSASLTTLNKAAWRYGRIETRARIPGGKGIWPAFWLLGLNRATAGWPRCGEIDIMEFIGREPELIHGTVHYALDGRHQSASGTFRTPRPFDAFHLYAIEWDAERIEFFFDGRKYFTFESARAGKGDDNPFRKPFYLLLNLALGGNWSGELDEKVLPVRYEIDYVRVFQRHAAAVTPR